jgi:hypothetical protein
MAHRSMSGNPDQGRLPGVFTAANIGTNYLGIRYQAGATVVGPAAFPIGRIAPSPAGVADPRGSTVIDPLVCFVPVNSDTSVHFQRNIKARRRSHQVGYGIAALVNLALRHFENQFIVDLHDHLAIRPLLQ